MNLSFFVWVLVYLVLAGVILWFVEKYVPMSPIFRDLIRIFVAIVAILLLLNAFGLFGNFNWGYRGR